MKRDLPHAKQIPTSLAVIKETLYDVGSVFHRNILRYVGGSDDERALDNYLALAALELERLSRLIYRNKKGEYVKPSEKLYRKYLFDRYFESEEEVAFRLRIEGSDPEDAPRVFKILRKTAETVCPMTACLSEQAFASEYAHAVDYVISRGGDLPKPVISSLFPRNYEGFEEYDPCELALEMREKYAL